jgi:16S rRNA (cytidine1402-2'-O)-methyltransferase
LPGASAFLLALVVSGLPADRFIFEGFFPVKPGQKKTRLLSLKDEKRTILFYESPHRILKTLETIKETLGDIEIVIARELTKKFEEVLRKKVGELIAYFSNKKILGEFVVLFNLSLTRHSEEPKATKNLIPR